MSPARPRRTPRLLATTLCAGLAGLSSASAETIYVDASADPGGDGTLWVRAYDDLADGLADAQPGDVVAVADGLYRPSLFDPLVSFMLPAGVSLRGGYAGQGAPDPDLRDPDGTPSVLSGDLLGNDLPGFLNREDNSRHVLALDGSGASWVLDGLTVRSGHADGPIFTSDGLGGGLKATTLGTVTLRDCRFEQNLAHNGGGAVAFLSSTVAQVEDCRFVGNRVSLSSGHGGALYQGNLTLLDSVFDHNESSLGQGGAVWASTTTLIEDCRFVANASRGSGSRGGAVVLNVFGGQPARVRACTFVANLAQPPTGQALGGALSGVNYVVDACRFYGNIAQGVSSARGGALHGSDLTVRDSLFSGNLALSSSGSSSGGALSCTTLTLLGGTVSRNRALSQGGGVHTLSASVPAVIANSILRGNTADGLPLQAQQLSTATAPTLTANSIHGWDGSLGGVGNIAANPLLVDSDGADGIVGTEDDDLELSPGSPCIDAGDVASLPLDGDDLDCDGQLGESSPLDIDGRLRRYDEPGAPDTGLGPAPLPDMGAHEYRAPLPSERWTAVGGALAGAFGTPQLAGGGTLCDESPLEVVLTEARPGTTATLVLGLSFLSAPFKGGTLVPEADVLVGGLPTGLGGFTLGLDWPAGLSGLQLVWQIWIADDTGPVGLTASNGLLSVAP